MNISTKSKTEELFNRRAAVVPRGVGVFVKSTAVSANGATITDADGRELIDFGGGIGVLNAGHCPEPVVKAIQEQAAKFIHGCFHVSTYEPYVELCEKLAKLFPHGDETKVMLTNTGAESVENAIKIARQYTGRQAVLAFTDAFHGRSMMAMTLTSKINYKLNCGPFAPEVYRLPFPNFYRDSGGRNMEKFVRYNLRLLEESALKVVNPKQLAAVIIEVIQGEGGFNPVPPVYLQGLRDFCDLHGIVLIFDEVQSGFCRTGKWAAYEHYDVRPDLSTWAKSIASGMPLGAVIGKAEVMDGAQPGTIGGTYLGNPVCCAAGIATIDFLESNNINARAVEVGKTITKRLKALQQIAPVIGDVRGLGAMVAFELVKNGHPRQADYEMCNALTDACLERGLLLLSAGTHKNVVRILSPLVITDEILDAGLRIIEEEILKLTAK
jgi:4-aminobutyrate aminotransferase/(S)-3-amino-2-methylpropionate transaminase